MSVLKVILCTILFWICHVIRIVIQKVICQSTSSCLPIDAVKLKSTQLIRESSWKNFVHQILEINDCHILCMHGQPLTTWMIVSCFSIHIGQMLSSNIPHCSNKRKLVVSSLESKASLRGSLSFQTFYYLDLYFRQEAYQ